MHRRAALRRCSPSPARRLRAARTLVFSFEGESLLGFNFLTKQEFECDADLLRFLAARSEWVAEDDLAGEDEGLSAEVARSLVEAGALVYEESEAAAREATYASSWKWGLPTALMHFCLDGASFVPLEESGRRQMEKQKTEKSPDLWQTNQHLGDVQKLPMPDLEDGQLALMAQRRTVRGAGGLVALGELADCLFAGLGITGETENCVGPLPLSMTPSGGARNPFEAYVFCRAVSGLAPGIYHYSAAEHSLGRVGTQGCPELETLIGGQDWVRGMPALVMLVGKMERPMWKYEDGNAYRVMLIEAGHIGQNVMLAATGHGLTACPTGAISHEAVRRSLDLCPVMDAPLYALALGRRN